MRKACEDGYSYAFRGEDKLYNSFPVGRDLQGRIAVHLSGRNLNYFPLWEDFVWKDSCAFNTEESLTPYSYRESSGGDRFAFKVEEF